MSFIGESKVTDYFLFSRRLFPLFSQSFSSFFLFAIVEVVDDKMLEPYFFRHLKYLNLRGLEKKKTFCHLTLHFF